MMLSSDKGQDEVFLSEAPKRVPKPATGGREAKSFPLSPTDGFILSRVDGVLDEGDLAESTGLPEPLVRASLAKLEALGLIVFGPPPPAQSGAIAAARRAPGATPPGAAPSRPGLDAAPSRSAPAARALDNNPAPRTAPAPDAASTGPAPSHSKLVSAQPAAAAQARTPASGMTPLTPGEEAGLLEDIDLDPDLRRRVIDAFRDLDRRDHYALLGVENSADKKLIKRAYFELAAAFHPDRYFRKRLGSFKVRMEAVFARLTIAYDTLSKNETRSEYDAYLSEQRISRAIEEHLASGLAQAKQAEAHVESLVLAAEPLAPVPAPRVPVSSHGVDLGARRDALARRLLGGNGARSVPSQAERSAMASAGGTHSPGGAMQTSDAVTALRRRYEERMHRAKAHEAQKFATQAEAALASGDAVAAANAFRIAANLNASDAELERKASEARVKADTLLADTYMRQARYEETQGQWPEASRSWARVCKAAPNHPIAHERAANAAVKASGDLHAAVRFGQRACELEPKNALFRVTLATCYSAAGMALNARRELDTAAQLAPQDGTIQNMIKRVGHTA
jgi:curved DNA-binding protein CbpA